LEENAKNLAQAEVFEQRLKDAQERGLKDLAELEIRMNDLRNASLANQQAMFDASMAAMRKEAEGLQASLLTQQEQVAVLQKQVREHQSDVNNHYYYQDDGDDGFCAIS
jgi:predicted  nucleic acid-binding Zn-ribbon protein